MQASEVHMKAEWKKPSLIVLSRGNPEEMVLERCKSVKAGFGGPQNGQNKCDTRGQGGNNSCGSCQAEPGQAS